MIFIMLSEFIIMEYVLRKAHNPFIKFWDKNKTRLVRQIVYSVLAVKDFTYFDCILTD